jgi:hypothetical protein
MCSERERRPRPILNRRRDVDSYNSKTPDAMIEVNGNEEFADILRKAALGA